MKFKNTNRGFVGILVLIIIVAVVSGGGVYVYQKQKVKTDTSGNYQYPATTTKTEVEATITTPIKTSSPTPVTSSNIIFSRTANASLVAMKDGKIIQTFSLDTEGKLARDTIDGPKDASFKFNEDLNFDGYVDVGLLVSLGYGGVNAFYDYYLYNPTTGTYVKSEMLTNVSIVQIDSGKKQITNSFKSGTHYMTEIFQWNGSTYVRSATR